MSEETTVTEAPAPEVPTYQLKNLIRLHNGMKNLGGFKETKPALKLIRNTNKTRVFIDEYDKWREDFVKLMMVDGAIPSEKIKDVEEEIGGRLNKEIEVKFEQIAIADISDETLKKNPGIIDDVREIISDI